MFQIFYDERAIKELTRLGHPVQKRLAQSIEIKLGNRPQDFGKPLRGSLKGDWFLRVGDWRAVYRIEAKSVIIVRIGHHREVYE